MIRLVLFDIDGTLIRSGGAGVKAFGETFATEFGLPEATRNVIFAGRTDVSLVRQVFRLNNIEETPENFARFFKHYPVYLEQNLHKLDGGPCEGVLEFIEALQTHESKPLLGLLTGNISRGAELKLRRYNLWHHFKFGAYADDHEDRNCIAGAAHKRGNEILGRQLAGDEIIVIGDTAHDVECGKSIGAKVLAVATGGVPLETLASHTPTWAVPDLRAFDLNAALR